MLLILTDLGLINYRKKVKQKSRQKPAFLFLSKKLLITVGHVVGDGIPVMAGCGIRNCTCHQGS